jgi:hypothetical protein
MILSSFLIIVILGIVYAFFPKYWNNWVISRIVKDEEYFYKKRICETIISNKSKISENGWESLKIEIKKIILFLDYEIDNIYKKKNYIKVRIKYNNEDEHNLVFKTGSRYYHRLKRIYKQRESIKENSEIRVKKDQKKLQKQKENIEYKKKMMKFDKIDVIGARKRKFKKL